MNRLRVVASLALAGVLAHGGLTFVRHATAELRSPWSRDYGEGCTIALGALLAERGSYFPALVDYPFLVANYPPVFVSVVAAGQRLFGPTLRFPRAVAFAATLALLVLLYRTLRLVLQGRAAPLAFTLVFVMPWFVTTWSALARVDTTALAFSLAGLWLALRRENEALPWAACALFWLAFFTKQNALCAPAAVLAELLLSRDRRFARSLAAYALPLAALVGLLALATHGQALRHLVTYTAAATYEWDRMGESYLQLGIIAAPLLLLAVAGGIRGRSQVAGAAESRRNGRILGLYLLLSLIGLASIAKEGAAQNYFLEPWLATVLAAAWGLRRLAERHPRIWPAWPLAAAIAAAVSNYSYPSLDRLPYPIRNRAAAADWVELRRLVHETPGPILSENLSMLVLDGRPVLLEPFGIELVAHAGLFRPDRLVRDCEAQRFPLVVAESRMWEIPGLGECLEKRYAPAATLGTYAVLRPRGLPALNVHD
jgi:dolichyl-phosphate-mannose-protein mannosyltransferase